MNRNFLNLRTVVLGVVIASAVMLCLSAPLLNVVSGQGGGRPTSTTPPKTAPKTTPPKKTTTPLKRPPARAAQPARSPARQTAPQLEMVLIPAGTFTMGSPDSEAGRSKDEGPQHRVTLQSFYMGKYEVTQAEWQAVMGTNPSKFKGDNLPVENVSWDDAQEFCRKLSQMTGKEYRLPTEAEWEYAARAGTTTPFAFGLSLSSEQANFNGNYPYGGVAKGVYRQQTTAVGSFQPNKFGLYGMHGNVWEWCQDWYHDSYNGAPGDGSMWESGGGLFRVLRGGSWNYIAMDCRSAARGANSLDLRDDNTGLRVVAVARS